MSSEGVDILDIVGVDHSDFLNSGSDITLHTPPKAEVVERVFRKGDRVVYRCGYAKDWGSNKPEAIH